MVLQSPGRVISATLKPESPTHLNERNLRAKGLVGLLRVKCNGVMDLRFLGLMPQAKPAEKKKNYNSAKSIYHSFRSWTIQSQDSKTAGNIMALVIGTGCQGTLCHACGLGSKEESPKNHGVEF